MYLNLKENEIFINPETGGTHTVLTGGIKLINIDVDSKRCNFLVKFYEDRQRMIDGKKHEYQKSFTIEDVENEKQDFSQMYASLPTEQMFGLEMEKLMYNYIISRPGYDVFEKIN